MDYRINHDGDLKGYRASKGLLTENEVIGLIALVLFLAAIADAAGWFI